MTDTLLEVSNYIVKRDFAALLFFFSMMSKLFKFIRDANKTPSS